LGVAFFFLFFSLPSPPSKGGGGGQRVKGEKELRALNTLGGKKGLTSVCRETPKGGWGFEAGEGIKTKKIYFWALAVNSLLSSAVNFGRGASPLPGSRPSRKGRYPETQKFYLE